MKSTLLPEMQKPPSTASLLDCSDLDPPDEIKGQVSRILAAAILPSYRPTQCCKHSSSSSSSSSSSLSSSRQCEAQAAPALQHHAGLQTSLTRRPDS